MFVPQEIVYTRNVPSCRKLSTMELSKRSCVNLSSLWLPSITVVGKHRAFEFDTSTFNNFLVIELLFFAAYVICKENYSLSSVVFLFFSFFFQTKIANLFYSKTNDSSRVRTTRFSSSKFVVRVSVVSNIFTI